MDFGLSCAGISLTVQFAQTFSQEQPYEVAARGGHRVGSIDRVDESRIHGSHWVDRGRMAWKVLRAALAGLRRLIASSYVKMTPEFFGKCLLEPEASRDQPV